VGGFTAVLCSAFLFFAWWQHRESFAALWWSAGHLTLGVAVTSLAVSFVTKADWLFPVGLTLLIASPALVWTGVRSFWGRPVGIYALAGGAAVWIPAFLILGRTGPTWSVPAVFTALIIGYSGAATWDLAVCRSERLRACLPLALLIMANAAIYLLSIPDAAAGRLDGELPSLASPFGLIHFESLVYVVGTTVFFVALLKERNELRHRHDAETDMLTKLPNRRAFLASAERLMERRRRDDEPFAVAAFDLDHFKLVNDTFGHAMGDRALQIFADVARDSLRPGDLVSRIGGEEFAAVFPGADLQLAAIMAERVRRAYAEAALVVAGEELGATVSVGVAVSGYAEETLQQLIERADSALYRAKLNGRDRVECDGEGAARRIYPRLVQVA
jgi:diguanylate cyclase (GGDEF)-like protein